MTFQLIKINNKVTGNINGRDIVYEDLRQICINKASADDWWAYALSFGKLCLVQGLDIKKCSYEVMDMVGINKDKIQECVDNSFDNKNNQTYSDNKLLKIEREHFIKKGVQAWPTLIINNVTFRVSLLFYVILLCSYFYCSSKMNITSFKMND